MTDSEKNKNIIIVDDDQIWLNQLSRAFERRGHNTYVAKSVVEAKDIISKSDIHYGVIDLRLDDGDGLEVILELQKKNPKSRSIILTGFGNIANAVSAIKVGAIDYLSKPATKEVLLLWGEWQLSYHQKILMKTKLLPKK